MKKIIYSFLMLLPFSCLHAQNIGIGTTIPTAKLTVEGNEITANGQGAAIKIQNTSSTNAWFLRAGGNGTNTPINGFSIADNIGYHFTMASGGNIGIGMMPSDAKFHVNGEMRLQGLNLFEFGAGVAGKEVNAGNVGYNAFGQNGLVFVGGGTTNLNRRMFFFAEGGTVMNGPLDFNGPLSVNGNSGTAGQVLTSNGTGTATWTDAAFNNNTRFAASFSAANVNTAVSYTVIYNTNTTNVAITTGSITINKPGLYHFEGSISLNANYTALPNSSAADITFITGPLSMDVVSRQALNRNFNSLASFELTERFSQDVYIASTGTVSVSSTIFSTLPTGVTLAGGNISGRITGYLISD